MNKSLLIVTKLPIYSSFIKPLTCLSTTKKYFSSDNKYNQYVPVYKFPYIRIISVINRLKLYQTFFTLAAIPTSASLAEAHIVPTETVWFAGSLGKSMTHHLLISNLY